MSNVLIIGAGGVGNVVAHKCAQNGNIFSKISLASRTKSKCDAIQSSVQQETGTTIDTYALDADDVTATTELLTKIQPTVVINVALPYQDLSIMDACLAAGVHYVDTANYEPLDTAKFEYHWQWAYHERFQKAGLTAVLGSGFDPGVTNAFCAYAQKHIFDTIRTIDIIDCNAGDHGHAFATNFNPEINIREITQPGRFWEKGEWKTVPALSVAQDFDFPQVGNRTAYLLYHEELESLAKNIKGLERIRFWMTFGEEYLTHLRVLQNVGMTRIDPVSFQGKEVVPIQFLKALLPDPASLSAGYTGKTSIGCLITGTKNGKESTVLVYNVCDHEQTHKEVGAQAVSYTTGVPAMVGGALVASGQWKKRGTINIEQLNPDPFLQSIGEFGLPWHVKEIS